MLALDERLFLLINRHLVSPALDFLMPIFSAKEGWIPVIVAVLVAFIFFDRRRGLIAALAVLIAFGITDPLCSQILKPLIGRIRPCYALGEAVRLLWGCGGKFSFPSNHAANSAAVVVAMGFFYRKTLWVGIPIALAVGFSRVYLGVHYPGDVLGGWIIGGAVGGTVGYVFHRIFLKSGGEK
ncbi:phosphatase PAP2 family protein [bacterium]|nr:phosphatase PAP2 family protein [bacterium]